MWANHSGCSPKMSYVSKSLRSLTKNEWPSAIHSGCSPKMSEWANRLFFWANCSFNCFLLKNEQFAQKTNEQIPSPEINWPNWHINIIKGPNWCFNKIKGPNWHINKIKGPNWHINKIKGPNWHINKFKAPHWYKTI